MGIENKEYYNIHSNTKKVYNYVINDIFDKDNSIIGYKFLKPNLSIGGYYRFANETYAYFLTHYFKAIDVFKENEELLHLNMNTNVINIIDIGANIGTVTFACLDYLVEVYKKINITINIIFVEVDNNRVKILDKAIKKYIQVSNLNIKYSIIEQKYEESIEDISKVIEQADTLILISNLLNWISDIEIFRDKLLDNMNCIDDEYQCNVINIETRSNNANVKLIDIYNKISEMDSNIRNIYINKRMPRFNNIEGCYYYDQKGVEKFNKSYEYYYGYIINDSDLCKTKNLDYIKKAYYKSVYSARRYFLFDQLEIKYTNSNLDNVIRFIQNNIENNSHINYFEYQYRFKKKKDEYRSMYLDDFMNDIINTTILITKGIKIDNIQNDEISYGNRLNKDLESPFTFNNYYEQYFIKYQEEAKKLSKLYSYYYKIDLRKFYNNIVQEKIKEEFFYNNRYGDKFYDKAIEYFVDKKLDQCNDGKGLAQGPDISHLLANLYLHKFDKWYLEQFPKTNMIRYVDDIIIFANGEEEATRIYNKCSRYLKENLNLEIGADKTEKGYTINYKMTEENSYIKDVINDSNVLLRSIYKLDKRNYERYKENPEEFIAIYQECLKRIGINLSKEWINIKINTEIKFLDKLKNKIKDVKRLISWVKKKEIYVSKVKLGNIPYDLSEEEINKWADKFSKSNKKYLVKLNNLKLKLDRNLEQLISTAKNNNESVKDIKSNFKFTLNKAGIFKINNMNRYIQDIYELFPYCNKVAFANYGELYDFIFNKLNEISLNSKDYDYAIYIWLLGEYKNTKVLKNLEDIYWYSYNEKEYFINTLVTEALLKIGQVTDEILRKITEEPKIEEDYYLIRNKLLLIKCFSNIDTQKEIIERYDSISDERVRMFLEWISRVKVKNILDIVEDIPQAIKGKYPDYPITNEYLSL